VLQFLIPYDFDNAHSAGSLPSLGVSFPVDDLLIIPSFLGGITMVDDVVDP